MKLTHLHRSLIIPAAALTCACDITPVAPTWETEWILPANVTEIRLDEVLPEQVRISDDGAAFIVAIPDTTISRSLSDICGSICSSLQGLTAPKPAIDKEFTSGFSFPDQLVSAEITGGSVVLTLRNGFGFDPMRPAAGVFGSLDIEVRSAGRVVASTRVDGRVSSFAPNSTLSRTLTFAPGPVSQSLEVAVNVSSPAGDRVRIDTQQRLELTAQPRDIRMTSIRLAIEDEVIPEQSVEFETGDLDDAIISRLRGGSLVLHLDNPLPMSGEFDVSISSADGPLRRSVSFRGPAQEELRADFDEAEMRAILREPLVSLNVQGTIRGSQDTVTVTPVSGITLRSELAVRVRYH